MQVRFERGPPLFVVGLRSGGRQLQKPLQRVQMARTTNALTRWVSMLKTFRWGSTWLQY